MTISKIKNDAYFKMQTFSIFKNYSNIHDADKIPDHIFRDL